MKTTHDLIVMGGGSAGLSLASVASRLGVKVALIDTGTLGGDCLHYGCVPSKTLIASAKAVHTAQSGNAFGFSAGDVTVDFPAVMKRVKSVITTIQDHVDNAERFQSMGCDVWTNTKATFIDPYTVDAGGDKISAKKIAICVGSRPREIDLPGLKESGYLTNETIFDLKKQPKKLIIIGGGPIGCELAQAFQRFGTKVTILSTSDRLLNKEDPDVSQYIQQIFEDEGIDIKLGVKPERVAQESGVKVVSYSDAGTTHVVQGDEILLAVGRQSNADSINAAAANVKLGKHDYIETNHKLQTSQKHIYAAGDITGHLQFTHSASYESGVVVSNALLHIPSKIDLSVIPWTTFTDPEIASVGINETTAKEKGIEHVVHRFSFDKQDRALAEGVNGFMKLILSKKGKLLGCQIVNAHAGELIGEWITAYRKGVTLKDLSRMTHVYPTLSMSAQQAAGEYMGKKFFTPRTRWWLRKIFRYRNTTIESHSSS